MKFINILRAIRKRIHGYACRESKFFLKFTDNDNATDKSRETFLLNLTNLI